MPGTIHIISFDVPWPADYGGVIDVFYKIKALHKIGVKIILHCFEYGRKEQAELNKYCYSVYYYKRKKNPLQLLSGLPFIVKSRVNDLLKKRLLKDNYPIIFEGLHCTFLLNHPEFKNRLKIYRESNIEHEYYRQLAEVEKNNLKKKYFKSEARKLEKYENILLHADIMLIVSETECAYFRKKFPGKKIKYLPSFNGNEKIKSKNGRGKYILFHGNLGVSENENAARVLSQEVFSKIKFPVIIAGKNPDHELKKFLTRFSNIKLNTNPDEKEMNSLIENAHIHVLYTEQSTGLKLKLLNVLFRGRFVLANRKMVAGTNLGTLCILKESPQELITTINETIKRDFKQKDLLPRKTELQRFSDYENINELVKICGI